jgi:hypothetical protein
VREMNTASILDALCVNATCLRVDYTQEGQYIGRDIRSRCSQCDRLLQAFTLQLEAGTTKHCDADEHEPLMQPAHQPQL